MLHIKFLINQVHERKKRKCRYVGIKKLISNLVNNKLNLNINQLKSQTGTK